MDLLVIKILENIVHIKFLKPFRYLLECIVARNFLTVKNSRGNNAK